MEVQLTARIVGTHGPFDRKDRLSTPRYPRGYLQHLVAIGVAVVTIEDKPEPPMQYKTEKKSTVETKPSASSQAAPASQKKTSKKQKRSKPSQSTPTTK